MISMRPIRTLRATAATLLLSALVVADATAAISPKTAATPATRSETRQRAAAASPVAPSTVAHDKLWPLLASGVGILCFMARRGSRR